MLSFIKFHVAKKFKHKRGDREYKGFPSTFCFSQCQKISSRNTSVCQKVSSIEKVYG